MEFLIALVADGDLSRVSSLLGEAIGVLRGTGAWIDSITGPLVFATLGTVSPKSASEPRARREAAVAQLCERLGNRVRIVHGCSQGITGDLGGHGFTHYGSCLARFTEAMRQLLSLAPGEARELM